MSQANADQKTFWSETAAARWLTYQDLLDASFQVVLDTLLDAADLRPGMSVLDVGCGNGTSCLQAAARVGPEGRVLGLDISEPFLARAEERSAGHPNVSYRLDDAQDAALPGAAFDRMISRFGVMFFADTTAAFANIARALKPGAKLTFAAWGQAGANPWFTVPHFAAATRLGHPPKSDRNAPGPFAFHDIARITNLLQAAGLEVIAADARALRLAAQVDLADLAHVATTTGAANSIIRMFAGTQSDAAMIEAEVLSRFQALAGDDGGLPGEINLYQCRKPV